MEATIESVYHCYTRVAGVSFPNRDGTSRQQFIQRCFPREQVFLEPEPDNPADPDAIRIVRRSGEQVGYLPAELARGVAEGFRDGVCFVGFVQRVLRPGAGYDIFGLELLVVEVPATATGEDFETYVNKLSPGVPA